MNRLATLVGKFLCLLYDLSGQTEYMRDVIDHFYKNHDIGWHWKYMKLPKCKRVFSTVKPITAVSAQPLSQPSGLVFHLDFEPYKPNDLK